MHISKINDLFENNHLFERDEILFKVDTDVSIGFVAISETVYTVIIS